MNSVINNGGPAFPVPGLQDDESFNGMTLRDYFAAKAMQAMLSNNQLSGPYTDYAERAYVMADAMLKGRQS